MTPTITIRSGRSGIARHNAHIAAGSKRCFMLMEHDYITLLFTSSTPVLFRLGDYITLPGIGRYELTQPSRGEFNKSTGGYDYELRFDAQYWKFRNRLCKFMPQVGGAETSWTYTDTIAGHASRVLTNMRAAAYTRAADGTETLNPSRKGFLYNGTTDWGVAIDSSVDSAKAVTVQYDGVNILDAVAAIAEAYECEWWFDGPTLRFGKCEHGVDAPVELEMGRQLVEVSQQNSQETYATRLYIYGSDRNLASNYRKELIFEPTVAGGKLHDPARPLELKYFRKGAIGEVTSHTIKGTLNFDRYNFRQELTSLATLTDIPVEVTPADNATGYPPRVEGFADCGVTPSECTPGEYIPAWNKVTVVGEALKMWFTPSEVTATNSSDVTVEFPSEVTARVVLRLYHPRSNGRDYQLLTLTKRVRLQGLGTRVEVAMDNLTFVTDFAVEGMEVALAGFDIHFNATDRGLPDGTDIATEYRAEFSGIAEIAGALYVKSGEVEYTPDRTEQSAEGITVELLDGHSGDKLSTITGCGFNLPPFDRKITLPAGATVPTGAKYRLPQLNRAIVPARYFTSRYAAFEKYAGITTNGIVNRRLLLPETDTDGTPLKGYIDAFPFSTEEEAVEDVVIFEDVYPSRISKITSLSRSDEYTADTPEQDGSTTAAPYREYIFTDDLFTAENPFDTDSYLLPDTDLQVTFQSGLLNGMTFNVEVLADGRSFQIKRNDTTELPNEVIRPEVDDTFILHGFNVAMLGDEATDYIARAETELLRRGREYVAKLNTDTSTYRCTVDCQTAYNPDAPDALYLTVGRAVNLLHPGYFAAGRISRVIGYEVPLDFAYDNPVFFVGEKAQYSRLGAIESKIESMATLSANTSSTAADRTPNGNNSPSEVLHATEADHALRADTAAEATHALRAGHAATATAADRAATLANGSVASIDAEGNATLESLTLRSYLRVQELIHNRLNALEGDTSFSDAGEIEALSPDGTVATMRRRWEGDSTPFQPGDILYGYSAPNADGAVFTKSWVKVVSVDRGNNALTLTAYPDTDVPAGKNFPVSVGMLLTRWGNASDSTRQSTAFVSSEGGHMVQLRDVAAPKITAANYATVWGRIPNDLRNALPNGVKDLINSAHPYLYARGIVVSDLIRTDYTDPTPPRYTPNLLDSTAQGVALWRYYASPSATLALAPHAASDYSPGYVGVDFPIGNKGLQWFTMFYPVAASAIRAGKSYTLSFCIYLDAPTSLQIDVATASGSAKATSTVYPAEPFPAGYSSHAIELTATADGFAGMVLRIAVSGAVSAALRNIRIGNLKLEEGYNDNPVWTPSYADLRGNDGTNGTNGLNGLLAYPAGVYDSEKTYTATVDTTPVVLYNEQYYSLRRGTAYRGSDPANAATSTPATDVAQLGSSSRWQHFDTFKSVFADIVMANFAKLGSAVFSGDWMLSQQGTLTANEKWMYRTAAIRPALTIMSKMQRTLPSPWSTTFPETIPEGQKVWASRAFRSGIVVKYPWDDPIEVTEPQTARAAGSEVSDYELLAYGYFTPHFSVNFATGELRANKGTIGGDLTASTLNLKVSSAGATTPDGSICVGVNAVTLPALTPGSVRSIRIFNPGKPAPLGAPSLTLTGADASVHITRMADPETTLQQFVMAKCGAGSGRFFEVIGYRKDSGLNTKTLWYVSELNNGSNKPLTFTLTEGGGFQVVETQSPTL